MGYMGSCMWNFFHVSCNVSYFAHVSLVEDFLQNSPSMIHSSMCMSSVDILVYEEFPSLHDLVIHVHVFISSFSWTSWYNFLLCLDGDTRTNNPCIYPHQSSHLINICCYLFIKIICLLNILIYLTLHKHTRFPHHTLYILQNIKYTNTRSNCLIERGK